jgi:cytochrome d ubiquinol oxidase subunit II
MNHVFWQSPWRGLEAVANPVNVIFGLAVLFLARVLGLLYLINTIDNDELYGRMKKKLMTNAVIFLVFFLVFVGWLVMTQGYAYDPQTKVVSLESHKYLHNLLQMPVVLVILLLGVVLVLWGLFVSLFKDSKMGIWTTGIGTVLTVLALFLTVGYNHTAFYPSSTNLQSSLTIENASSSYFTLKVMAYVSILIPFVFAYIWYAWKSINVEKITDGEVTSNTETHIY